MDQNRAKAVLAGRLKKAYDDLFLSDKEAQTRTVEKLKGWFKTKTGAGDAVANKMATTFKSLASYADFSQSESSAEVNTSTTQAKPETVEHQKTKVESNHEGLVNKKPEFSNDIGFVYRIEIHLPDTTNIETYRSIFRAIREELQS